MLTTVYIIQRINKTTKVLDYITDNEGNIKEYSLIDYGEAKTPEDDKPRDMEEVVANIAEDGYYYFYLAAYTL